MSEKLNDSEVALPKGVISKEIEGNSWGMCYLGWEEDMYKKYGNITEDHILQPVRLASGPHLKNVILIKTFEPGVKMWPHGGHLIKHPDYDRPRAIFLDEIIPHPPKRVRKKKSKVSSQLSRKKKTKAKIKPKTKKATKSN